MAVALTLSDQVDALGGRLTARQLAAGAAPWLRGPLLATDAARARLEDWCAHGGLERSAPSVEALREGVQYFGDDELLPIVAEALSCMAPPARDYVLSNAAIFGTGWSTYGWVGCRPPNLLREIRHVVLLSGARRDPRSILRTALHEFAHVWLETSPGGLVSAAGRAAFCALGAREGWLSGLESAARRTEYRADELMGLWQGSV